jgi:hypothetical protein
MKWLRLTPGTLTVVVTLLVVTGVVFSAGGSMFSPGPLNADNPRRTPLGGVSSHADIAGNCSACHTSPLSRARMADRCMECHITVREEMTANHPLHGTLSADLNCQSCHTEHRGAHAPLTNMSKFDHNWTAFQLTGMHKVTECANCHKNNTFKGTPQTCVGCHATPAVPTVHKATYGNDCARCHTTFTFSLAKFNHDTSTAFKLTGGHRNVECASCHKNNVFKGTPQTCVGCHATPAVPTVHKVNHGTDCARCHTTSTWASAKFDHDTTGFKLTGKHTSTACASCHKNDTFKGTPKSCVGCHESPAVPTVHKVDRGADCARCHTTTTFVGAKFDHDTTGFKLTGKHTMTACAACHKNDVFKGTPQTCVGCHATPAVPAVHKMNYGTDCAHCHTTATFTGSTFKHTAFPITHGNRRMANGNACTTCHKDEKDFKSFTCFGCHAHTAAKTEAIHTRRNILDTKDCMKCHGRGRKEGGKVSLDLEELLGTTADAVPVCACPQMPLTARRGVPDLETVLESTAWLRRGSPPPEGFSWGQSPAFLRRPDDP